MEPAPTPARSSAAPTDRGPAAGPAGTPGAGGGTGVGRPPALRRGGDEAEPGEANEATGERGLRGLIGGGSSQVSPGTALRARDASRPGADDLARAEAELTIVRRHWTPPTPTP